MNPLTEALKIVGSSRADSNLPVRVNQKFLNDFAIVSRYYLLDEHGDLEAAKAAARGDLASAITAYDAMAREIEHELPVSTGL